MILYQKRCEMIMKEKFATQINTKLITAIREIAEVEGKQIQILIDEALNDLVNKRKNNKPRDHVMLAYQASHKSFGKLYKKLAQ